MQEYEQAVISYNQALQIKNDYTDAWNNRGVALSKLQKYEAAIASYDNAAKIRPDFYRIWYNKARCYALQG
ncbi:tetratricopeptide repeat protein [Microcoleus sp. K1-B6]